MTIEYLKNCRRLTFALRNNGENEKNIERLKNHIETVTAWIDKVTADNPGMNIMLRSRFINCNNWTKTALLGGYHSPDVARVTVNNFLKKTLKQN